jgi:hypothetical protein
VLPGSLTVRDDDHDGVGEATAAWFALCHTDAGQYPVKLALLSGSRKDILRGEALPRVGSPRFTEAERRQLGAPAASFTAEPAPGRWPANSYRRAVTLYHQLVL